MATNYFKVNGSVVLNHAGLTDTGNMSYTQNLVGNGFFTTVNVAVGSWQAIPTGSIKNLANVWFYNNNADLTASIITVATDSAGTKPVTVLSPGDSAVLPQSGSVIQYYVNATVSSGSLQYGLTEQ